MELWMYFIIVAILAIVIEIFSPTLFCINFAFAGVITAIVSIFWGDIYTLCILFAGLSVLSIWIIKPILAKLLKKESHADFNAQYIGKIVKSIEPITETSGAVTIYEENWQARIKAGAEEIPAGCDVKIISNDSLTLYVEKI